MRINDCDILDLIIRNEQVAEENAPLHSIIDDAVAFLLKIDYHDKQAKQDVPEVTRYAVHEVLFLLIYQRKVAVCSSCSSILYAISVC